MKTNVLIIFIFLLVSCFKTNKEIKPYSESIEDPKPSSDIAHVNFLKFNVGSIHDLANRSPALAASTQNTDGQLVFITGEIIILAYDHTGEKLAYLENLPKVTEDISYTTELLIHDLRNNNLLTAKQWDVNHVSPEEAALENFYDTHKTEVEKVLKGKGVINHSSEISISTNNFQKPKLKKELTKTSGDAESKRYIQAIVMQGDGGADARKIDRRELCTACDSTKITETDVVAKINLKSKYKIYMLGSSQEMEHAPAAIYPRFYAF